MPSASKIKLENTWYVNCKYLTCTLDCIRTASAGHLNNQARKYLICKFYWYVSSKCQTVIMIIITIITIIVIFIIIIIIIITYVWIMCTREQVPQSNLSNNEGRSKKLWISCSKWKHITRKHGHGHDDFKSLAITDTMNLQKCLSY